MGIQQRLESFFRLCGLSSVQQRTNINDFYIKILFVIRQRLCRFAGNCLNCAVYVLIDRDTLLFPFTGTNVRPVILGRNQRDKGIGITHADLLQIQPSAPLALHPNAFKVFATSAYNEDLFTAQHCRPDLLVVCNTLLVGYLTAEHLQSSIRQLLVDFFCILLKIYGFQGCINDLIILGGKSDLNTNKYVVVLLFGQIVFNRCNGFINLSLPCLVHAALHGIVP